MRIVKNPQLHFDQVDISEIQFNPRSRDDIPAILKGLQHIYIHLEVREKVFELLANSLDSSASQSTGRPGMELWKVFVLGTLKLGLNCDFDRLQELANHHSTIRQMLGHSGWDDDREYPLQTLIDNVSRLKPEVLVDINQVVVDSGHELLKKKSSEEFLKGRCDSFVVETDVHYPTDINLLWDALRKVILSAGRACEAGHIQGWRQYRHQLRQVKKLFRRLQKVRYSNSKKEEKQEEKRREVHRHYREYLQKAGLIVSKAQQAEDDLIQGKHMIQAMELSQWITHAKRQIDQIERRVLQGQKIPHSEKVFSIFEPHTEWICKGKAGVPVELGVRVCVLEDQHQFILHHRIMWQETDDKVAIDMVEAAQRGYPELKQCSFDKGFYSPENQAQLSEMLDRIVLPKKGRLSEVDKIREQDEAFQQARYQHSAVESCINNMEVRGLDRCHAYGRHGFERHVSLSVVSCNIHRIGMILQRQERKRLQKLERRKCLPQAA